MLSPKIFSVSDEYWELAEDFDYTIIAQIIQ